MTGSAYELDLSVVIPTHNRREVLLATLRALDAQTMAPDRFEVIVVFDSCSDGSFAETTALDWNFALHAVSVSARNAASARNAGAERSRGSRIVFLDDDIAVEPGFLEAHLAAAGRDGRRIVLGPVIPDIDGPGWFKDDLRGWWADRAKAQAHPGHRFGFTDLATGNVSISTEDFLRLGEFNTCLSVREDYELGWRAVAAGIPMILASGATGHHRDESDLSRNLARVRAEGGADAVFARMHPTSFAALRVSGLAAQTPSSRLLRFFAFDAPFLAAPLVATLAGMLPLFERLRLRRLRDRMAEVAWGFSYHCGAAAEIGSRDALWDIARTDGPSKRPALQLDLCDGIDLARSTVGLERPDELSIRIGSNEIGRILAWPGLEPLAERHLDNWLRQNSHLWARGIAVASRLPPLPAVCPVLSESGWSVGEIDLADWSIRPASRPLSLPLQALVRSGDEILGWIRLTVADVREGNLLRAARDAILADTVLSDALVRMAAVSPQQIPESLPPISVVVCSRDRTESLTECLAALSDLDYPDREVIVVDNAPESDATERLVAQMPGVRYVREDRPGLDWARNRGLSEARHGIIAYTDDDTRADRYWLRGLARAFADHRVAAVTGLVTPMDLDGEAQNYFEFIYGGMGKGFLARRWSLADMGSRRILWSSGCGVGANMAFRRDALEALGGFDPALDVGTATRGGGDVEMFHRLLARDFVLRYEPSALVWHLHRKDWTGLARQLQDNGSGFGAYLLTAWRRRTVPRRQILTFALRDWIWNWQFRRLLRPGVHRRKLVWSEITGMLAAPVRLRKATAANTALRLDVPSALPTSTQRGAEPSQ